MRILTRKSDGARFTIASQERSPDGMCTLRGVPPTQEDARVANNRIQAEFTEGESDIYEYDITGIPSADKYYAKRDAEEAIRKRESAQLILDTVKKALWDPNFTGAIQMPDNASGLQTANGVLAKLGWRVRSTSEGWTLLRT